jgi:hypothetical protein
MRTFAALPVVVAILIGLASPPAIGEASSSTSPVATNRVEVTGVGGSVGVIAVPEDAVAEWVTEGSIDAIVGAAGGSFRSERYQTAEIDGDGAYQGVLLVAEGPSPAPGKTCGGLVDPECTPVAGLLLQTSPFSDITLAFPSTTGFDRIQQGRFHVPAGEYRVVLLGAAGVPQRVAFDFSGLDEGTTSLRLTDELEGYVNGQLAPRLPEVGAQVQSFGSSYRSEEWTYRVSGMTVQGGQRTTGRQVGVCLYGGSAQPEAIAYLPGCPSRFTGGGAVDISFSDLNGTRLSIAQAAHVGAGDAADGWWFVEQGVGGSASGAELLIDLAEVRGVGSREAR